MPFKWWLSCYSGGSRSIDQSDDLSWKSRSYNDVPGFDGNDTASGQCLFTSYAFFPAPLLKHPNSWYVKLVNGILPYCGAVVRLMNKYPEMLKLHLPVFHHTKGFEYATGMKMTFGHYMRCGERGYNLEREINRRFGVNANKDALPSRLVKTLRTRKIRHPSAMKIERRFIISPGMG